MFFPSFDQDRGWRIRVDYRAIGGDVVDICGAISELVALETCALLNAQNERRDLNCSAERPLGRARW